MKEQLLPSPERQIEILCYSIADAAIALDLCETEVKNLVHSEGFPAFHIGRRVLISRDRLKEWVKKKADEGMGDHYIRKEA
ncbi:MAG: helix-turn-helix domain-containing protein [Oscillospiraceae bacterium]|nr:helix-turn-helix domain-containing protein [Oscillospiraceae bacterium]